MSVIKKFRITKIKKQKPLISLKKISLSFNKKHIVLDNISLDISKGQVIGLLGPNGAGKSSLMNIITGLVKPNSGEIFINNQDISQYPIYERSKKFKISLVPQIGGFFSDLSTEDNLNAVGEIQIKNSKERKSKIEQLISKFELDVVRKIEAKFLSGGMKRRLVISMSLLGDPEILLMDEPLAALDPQTIQMLQNIIVTLQTEYNLTIIITDHQARDLLAVCDKAIILSNSKVVAEGTPNQLINNKDATKYYFGENFKFK
ncbi:ATP-binding cassette domain-containing protein [Candidatus Pelagibacter sp.]|uniref:ATP-binding cassette domain-containing protein n=1 Tax=Candidatus Pelagibacter sp. TaxID=2024849 RepID=UPI003F857381